MSGSGRHFSLKEMETHRGRPKDHGINGNVRKALLSERDGNFQIHIRLLLLLKLVRKALLSERDGNRGSNNLPAFQIHIRVRKALLSERDGNLFL